MGDEGEIWNRAKEIKQKQKWEYCDYALKRLHEVDIKVVALNAECGHYRIGEFDFWATTGTFMHRETKERGYGVEELIKKINKK